MATMTQEKLLEEAEYILLEGNNPDENAIDTIIETWHALIEDGYRMKGDVLLDAELMATVPYEPKPEIAVGL